MNSSYTIPYSFRPTSTQPYTLLQLVSEGSVPSGSTNELSFSWKKFVSSSTQQAVSESAVTVIPVERTTTEGPTVLNPAPLPDDYDAKIEEFLHLLDSFESETETTDDVTAEQ